MTRSRFEYRMLSGRTGLAALFRKVTGQGLQGFVWPEALEWNEDYFVERMSAPEIYLLGAYAAGELAGVLMLRPFGENTLCAETGLTCFRPFFARAIPMCHGAFGHVMREFRPAPESFIGRVASFNRHILPLLPRMGFSRLARVPGLFWHNARERYVDGHLVLATPQSIEEARESEEWAD